MNIRILTNILDFGIKSKYRLCRTIVVLVGASKANDILFVSSIAAEQTVMIKTKIEINKIRTLVILSATYYSNTIQTVVQINWIMIWLWHLRCS